VQANLTALPISELAKNSGVPEGHGVYVAAPSVILRQSYNGIVTEVREEQSEKAPSPMLVTESPMVTEEREEQLLKAISPMLVTESGIITEVREEHP